MADRSRATGEPLPRLIDCRGIQEELGVKRTAAEAIMRNLPVVQIDGLRKTYVRRDDVLRLLEDRSRSSGRHR